MSNVFYKIAGLLAQLSDSFNEVGDIEEERLALELEIEKFNADVEEFNARFDEASEDDGDEEEDELLDEEDYYEFDEDEDDYSEDSEEEDPFDYSLSSPSVPSWPRVSSTTHQAVNAQPTQPVVPSWPRVSPAQTPATSVVATVTGPAVVAHKPAQAATPKATATQAVVPTRADNVLRGTFTLGSRNRLLIQSGFVRHVGLKPGDVAHVALRAGGNGLILMKRAPKSGLIGRVTVSRHGEIRLSNRLLTEGGLPTGRRKSVDLRTTDRADGILVM